jgi:hypothetical protein
VKKTRKGKESELFSPDSFGLTDFILSTFGIAMHRHASPANFFSN